MNKNVLCYLFGAATACAWSIPFSLGYSFPFHVSTMIPLFLLSVRSVVFLAVNTIETAFIKDK